jgi:hypothetical protein
MCGSTKQPKTPDPVKTAQAQAQYDIQAAKAQAALNAINQYGPYGSTTYTKDAEGVPSAQTVTLSPEVQQWLDSQFGASRALTDAAQTQLGFLPTDRFQLPSSPDARGLAQQAFGSDILNPENFSNIGDVAKTSYDQAKSLIQPDIDAARKAKQIELANRGIPVGSEIYNDEMNRLDTQANNAYAQASRQANLDATQTQAQRENSALTALNFGNNAYQTNLSNQLLERDQPFSEAAALLGANPNFQTPSFINTPATQVSQPQTYANTVNSNYATQSQIAQQNRNGLFGAIGSIGSAVLSSPAIFSDENMKEQRAPADGEMILARFRKMPVDDYRYKDEAQGMFGLPEFRTGTMAQDYAKHFGGDGRTIDAADAIGKLMAAVKALDARTARRAT